MEIVTSHSNSQVNDEARIDEDKPEPRFEKLSETEMVRWEFCPGQRHKLVWTLAFTVVLYLIAIAFIYSYPQAFSFKEQGLLFVCIFGLGAFLGLKNSR